MLNNIAGYWAYIRGIYIQGVLYSGGRLAYIWNEVSISTCGGLIQGGGLDLEVYGIQPYRSDARCQCVNIIARQMHFS